MAYTPPEIKPGLDTLWTCFNTFIIFYMQLGFTMVEAGTVRVKNIHAIIMKNCLDICIATYGWWIIGYSFGFGESQGGFVGMRSDFFFSIDLDTHNNFLHFMQQLVFSQVSATILSGATAERITIKAYLVMVFIFSILIYPIIVHWIWAEGGWLKENSFHDFGGVTTVHVTGGIVGLVSTIMLKPRLKRFDTVEDKTGKFKPNSVPFVVLGTLSLWFCWYAFNSSGIKDLDQNFQLAGLVGLNTTIGAVSGGLSCFIGTLVMESRTQYDLVTLNICMGIISGLVSVTGCCDRVEPYYCILIGGIGGILFLAWQKCLNKLKIDDPLDATTIHLGCGIWGTLATGIFSNVDGLIKGGFLIGIQIGGLITVLLWASIVSFLTLKSIQSRGFLRIHPRDEETGFDKMYNEYKGEKEQLHLILEGMEELKALFDKKKQKTQ